MTTETDPAPLDLQTALRVCREVQAEVRGKPWSSAHWQCWGCVRFSHGDPEKMCISAQPGYRGCALVNRWLEKSGTG